MIDCEVNFNHLQEEFVPFTAAATDTMNHGVEIFQRCVAGEFGIIAEYVAPPAPEPTTIPVTYTAPPTKSTTPSRAELTQRIEQLEALVNKLLET
jgi:hypothetical protein